MKSSPVFQTTGGRPLIACGSYLRISSRIGSDAGTGNGVRIVRYFVRTCGTFFGVIGKTGILTLFPQKARRAARKTALRCRLKESIHFALACEHFSSKHRRLRLWAKP